MHAFLYYMDTMVDISITYIEFDLVFLSEIEPKELDLQRQKRDYSNQECESSYNYPTNTKPVSLNSILILITRGKEGQKKVESWLCRKLNLCMPASFYLKSQVNPKTIFFFFLRRLVSLG